MRTALLLALCLSATGCWKEIHEAAGPRAEPDTLAATHVRTDAPPSPRQQIPPVVGLANG